MPHIIYIYRIIYQQTMTKKKKDYVHVCLFHIYNNTFGLSV